MKKIVTSLVALPIFFICEANAQSLKKLPLPPPPPKAPTTVPATPQSPVIETQDFLKQNPSIKNIEWQGEEKIIVSLKNGKVENYDLQNAEEKKSFTDQYGTVPIPPPPPPKPPKKEE